MPTQSYLGIDPPLIRLYRENPFWRAARSSLLGTEDAVGMPSVLYCLQRTSSAHKTDKLTVEKRLAVFDDDIVVVFSAIHPSGMGFGHVQDHRGTLPTLHAVKAKRTV